MEYSNGEVNTVDIRKAKPEDFDPPTAGSVVCVQSKGGKYSATIKEVLDVRIMHVATYSHYKMALNQC